MRKLASTLAVPLVASLLLLSTSPSAASGGGGSGGGGTKPSTSGPIGNVGFNPNPLVGGQPGNLFLAFTFGGVTPPHGVDLRLASSDPAVQVPSFYHAPGGVFNVEIPLGLADVPSQRTVNIAITSGSQTKTASATLFPLHATFSAPKLQTPGDGSKLGFRILTKFAWSTQPNAFGYEIQIATNPAFEPADVTDLITPNNFWAQSAFGGTNVTHYWRVRAVDASGAGGPWSPVWRFSQKPQ